MATKRDALAPPLIEPIPLTEIFATGLAPVEHCGECVHLDNARGSNHGRASTVAASSGRAANVIILSAVIPASRMRGQPNTAAHHSAGIASRCHHFETAHLDAPISAASASRVAQSSMIDRNESRLDMTESIGQLVLKSKAIMSYDCLTSLRDYWLMSRTAYEEAFLARTKAARKATGLTQVRLAAILQIPQDHYKTV